MSTRWRWLTISPEVELTLTLERVERSAADQGIVLERIEPAEPEPGPLPEDYWETAQ